MVKLLLEGYSQKDIATELGLTEGRITQLKGDALAENLLTKSQIRVAQAKTKAKD